MADDKRRLTSYVDSMREASSVITRENPDFVVAPMSGSIPFIDAMAIVDRDFDPSKVVYMPASSRIADVSRVIKDWYGNFLGTVVESPHEFPAVLGIDEVVSGSSVVRCMKPIDLACSRKRTEIKQDLVESLHSPDRDVALDAVRSLDILTRNKNAGNLALIKERIADGTYRIYPHIRRNDEQFFVQTTTEALDGKLTYRTIGIEDGKKPDAERNKEYKELRAEGRIIPIRVERIISMDDPNFSTAVFEDLDHPYSGGYVRLSPRVIGFNIPHQYIDFLTKIARHVGVDPSKVNPINTKSILDSARYLAKQDANN